MKSADITQYLTLRNALLAERASIQARLQEIATALDERGPATAATATAGGKRTFSAATKAKMAAAQRARWASKRAGKAPAPVAAPKAKRKMSAEGRARIIAATKARWAKIRAAKAKAPAGGK